MSVREVVTVLAVLGMVVGLVTVNVRNYRTWARQEAARKDIAAIVQALDAFRAMNDRFPTKEEGLSVLVQPTARSDEPLLRGGSLDPWGRPYRYETPAVSGPYKVVCLGADGCEGGQGGDADISSDESPD